MKAKTASPETAVLTAERKLHNTWVYIKRHWQLYLLFLLPAVALTLVFNRNADALFQPHLTGVKAAPVALDLLAFGISCHNQPPSLGSTYRITEWPVKP